MSSARDFQSIDRRVGIVEVVIAILLSTALLSAGAAAGKSIAPGPLPLEANSAGKLTHDLTQNSQAANGKLAVTPESLPRRPSVDACALAGKVVPSPNEAVGRNSLEGIVAIAPDDAWAVGTESDYLPNDGEVLIEHWDGTRWTIVPTDIAGALYSVDATSASDVWAVGECCNYGSQMAVIMHWDGSSWSQVASDGGPLADVEALAPDDVWAVGQAHILHYDGTEWRPIPTPRTSLNALSAVAPHDIWAVGSDGAVLHWDGVAWSSVPISETGELTDVFALAPDDVWAVGNTPDYPERGFAIHWDGASWHTVPVPDILQWSLEAIGASGPDDVWATGYTGSGPWDATPLIMHWDGTRWSIVPNSQTGSGSLVAISVLTSGNMWAVGAKPVHWDGSQTLTMRWDGAGWRVVASANQISGYNFLEAVSLISPTDGWAVGSYANIWGPYQSVMPLIERWDGNSWRSVPAPQVLNQTRLADVVAVSSSDAWAVGSSETGSHAGCCSAVIMHWDGTQWSLSSNAAGGRMLLGVAAIPDEQSNATEVWAVGSYAKNNLVPSEPLVIHWDGGEWHRVPVTAPLGTVLYAIDGASSGDLWSVGTYSGETPHQTWIMHWNGAEWQRVPSPNPGFGTNSLASVKVIATDDVWAVGSYADTQTTGAERSLIMHWDGSTWQIVPSPDMGAGSISLSDVTATGPNDVWAVGKYQVGGVVTPLALRWDGSRWNVVQSVTLGSGGGFGGIAAVALDYVIGVGSYISDSARLTMVQEFGPISFTDVPPDSTFHPFVQCLACQGIFSGYPDGTFRPNAHMTRGQIAKVVSNAAGLSGDPGEQIYEDVPPPSPFYAGINRLSRRGYAGGYRCGGPEEPCGPDRRPYFRPNAYATRAQIAKIVANAAELSGTPSGVAYTDVPSDHPFNLWIMRLTDLGVMGGYRCGGEGEPCDDQSRPYFRPSNNVTRGQGSKMAANTFFPGCQTGEEP